VFLLVLGVLAQLVMEVRAGQHRLVPGPFAVRPVVVEVSPQAPVQAVTVLHVAVHPVLQEPVIYLSPVLPEAWADLTTAARLLV